MNRTNAVLKQLAICPGTDSLVLFSELPEEVSTILLQNLSLKEWGELRLINRRTNNFVIDKLMKHVKSVKVMILNES